MKTTVTARHFDLTDALVKYIEDKIEQQKTHFVDVLEGEFVLSYESHHERQVAEVKLHVTGDLIHSEAESEDMYKSIDQLFQKIITILDKRRDKATR
ncbi:MAG: ribosome-associated translation inhibitor RaiA [Candidatus Caenarcaniphilales bacterium]|nr:ribosome-associated translation inhibitor RaiA [Candidatus Caenarcaniphilales bacterium]